MTRTLLIAASIGFGIALAGPAAAAEFSEVDADANGLVSLAEIQAVSPEVTEDEFNAHDSDADGSLIQSEYDALSASMDGGDITPDAGPGPGPGPEL